MREWPGVGSGHAETPAAGMARALWGVLRQGAPVRGGPDGGRLPPRQEVELQVGQMPR